MERLDIKISTSVEKDKLEKFIFENEKASIFQTNEMADVYKINKDTTPLTLTAINDNGEILACLLAKILRHSHGILGSLTTHSTIRGGPIFANTKEGLEAVSLLLRHYEEFAKKEALYTRIYPLFETPDLLTVYAKEGYAAGGWQNFLIDLTIPEKQLWSNMSTDKKRGIKRAEKNKVTIHELKEKKHIPIFYSLIKETFTKRKNPIEDISNFEAVFDVLVPKNMAKFFLAEYNGEYVATRLALLYKGVVYDWYAGASNENMKVHPNDLLVWHILKWGKENGFQTFDFGGGGEPGDNSGFVLFKKSFGGRVVNYGSYTKIHKPMKYWVSQKGYKFYQLCRGFG